MPAAKKKSTTHNPIIIYGAKTHNLKNITVEFPRYKLTVVTGVSGSGKSSLVFDTLFAEGVRKYSESLTVYARQFFNRMEKPPVDNISGLAPTIAIEQKVINRAPRSTVGTLTEIYDYLRILYARIGKTYSPISGKEVKAHTIQDVWNAIVQIPKNKKIFLLTLLLPPSDDDISALLSNYLLKGYIRLYFHTKEEETVVFIEDILNNTSNKRQYYFTLIKKKKAFILIDRLTTRDFTKEDQDHWEDMIQSAFLEGEGTLFLLEYINDTHTTLHTFSHHLYLDNILFENPHPQLFSFNHSLGACPTCQGIGEAIGISPSLVIPNKTISLYEGAVIAWHGKLMQQYQRDFIQHAQSIGFPIHTPIKDLSADQFDMLWNGRGHAKGIIQFFKDIESQQYKFPYRILLGRFAGLTHCNTCNGKRLRKESQYVKIQGKTISDISALSLKDLNNWIQHDLQLSSSEKQIAERILIEIKQRLSVLLTLGLNYLSLERSAHTLSGGESQRIHLAKTLGSPLTDTIYILDEPSIGLHSKDTEQLIRTLQALRDLGNTVIVVEHDTLMMQKADHIIDIGPLASYQGGSVVATGSYKEIIENKKSITSTYLKKTSTCKDQKTVRAHKGYIEIIEAYQNNLQSIHVKIPLGVCCVISGVSGSGKSTLIKQVLYESLKAIKNGQNAVGCKQLIKNNTMQIEWIDQDSIGRNARSNPISYIQAYEKIRNFFANLPQAIQAFKYIHPGYFSFNVPGGRCEACEGEGEQVIDMQFLAPIHVVCEVCKGKQFKDEILNIKYKDKNIHDVLSMSVDEAITFFQHEPTIVKSIQPLQDVGLGYIALGQSSSSLSGGEAQRVKLAFFLSKGQHTNPILFIFDEPTTGLHAHDITHLITSFNALISHGHSLIIIEHNTEIIKAADWVIELGPGAGTEGGKIVFQGIPSELKKCKESATQPFL